MDQPKSNPYTGPFGHKEINRLIADDDVEGLIEALSYKKVGESLELRTRIVNALGNLEDSRAVDVVSEILLRDPDGPMRGTAAIALTKIEDPKCAPALRKALSDRSTANQQWAIRGLGLLRDRESVEPLIAKLGTSHSGIRRFAALALGEIGDQRATLPLIDRLEDSNRRVRRAAAEGLVLLGDSRAIGPLKETYVKAGWLNRRDTRRALAELEARFR
jgi:HEAT repeat protein